MAKAEQKTLMSGVHVGGGWAFSSATTPTSHHLYQPPPVTTGVLGTAYKDSPFLHPSPTGAPFPQTLQGLSPFPLDKAQTGCSPAC